MQLLKITTNPMKYELEITPAKLEYQQNFIPRADVETTASQLKIRTEPGELRLDSYEARKSLGIVTVGDQIRSAAERSQQIFAQNIRSTIKAGQQMANIEDGVTISQIIRQKMLEQPQTYTAFLPSAGVDITWKPNEMEMNYTPGETNYNWEIKSPEFQYIPGSVKMRITEYASVDVEYLGSPMYVPPSADPTLLGESEVV
ncbi:DUF6470 family protein [Scatolibacter rhodanostii]|uniref:DUF6470 family protein n=1 Tax=Scatolibacter rhodanostii TaxID=2014781 RepID=UPI000C088548|nr:DUF6470 family protein [Scatolibacter rhodanostii]